MNPPPISNEGRQRLRQTRDLLLRLHKLLLDRERGAWERINGPIGSPNQFLQLLLSHPHFEWLRHLTGLIVEIDETLEPRNSATADEGAALAQQVRALLTASPDGDEFHRKYDQALQDSPDVVLLHGEIGKALGR